MTLSGRRAEWGENPRWILEHELLYERIRYVICKNADCQAIFPETEKKNGKECDACIKRRKQAEYEARKARSKPLSSRW